jgi:hypothetical protein
VETLRSLWAGKVPLRTAFWEYAIFYGFILNLFTTIASFALLAFDVPTAIAMTVFFLPLPYNLFVLVAVWRSAAHYDGPPHWANAARIAVAIWVVVATVA